MEEGKESEKSEESAEEIPDVDAFIKVIKPYVKSKASNITIS